MSRAKTLSRTLLLILVVASVCKGSINKFGNYKESLAAIEASSSDMGISTYFWDDSDERDETNITVRVGLVLAILTYDTSSYDVKNASNKKYACIHTDVNEYNFAVGKLFSAREKDYDISAFGPAFSDGCRDIESGESIFAYDNYMFYIGSGKLNRYTINDSDNYGLDWSTTYNDAMSKPFVVDDKYLAYTNDGIKNVIRVRLFEDLYKNNDKYTDITLPMEADKYKIAINENYILVTIDNYLMLYREGDFSKPMDTYTEDINVLGCTFDKNTGLIYYATNKEIVCVDPKDFKKSSTVRQEITDETGSDSGDIFVHRSGKVIFVHYKNITKYEKTIRIHTVEVDDITAFDTMNITECMENPLHRVWGLKSGKCMLSMSVKTEEECNRAGCIKNRPAKIESIKPTTGPVEGGTRVNVTMSNVNLTGFKDLIKVFIGGVEAKVISYDESINTINCVTSAASISGSKEKMTVKVTVNDKLIHAPESDDIKYTYYNCGPITKCAECVAHSTQTEYPSECRWCPLENKCRGVDCKYNAPGRSLLKGACPSFSFSPNDYSAPDRETNLAFRLEGENANEEVHYYCTEDSKLKNFGNVTLEGDTMKCTLPPVDGDVYVEVYASVGASEDKVFYAKSSNKLIVKECYKVKSRKDCLTFTHCTWCYNETYGSFSCTLNDESECTAGNNFTEVPTAIAVSPYYVEFKSYNSSERTQIEVTLNQAPVGNNTKYTCAFSSKIIPQSTSTSTGTYAGNNVVVCDIPEGVITEGGMKVDVMVNIGNGDELTEPTHITSLQCDLAENVSRCTEEEWSLNGLCKWCTKGGVCTSACPSKCAITNNNDMPSVSSVTPDYFNVRDGTAFNISGKGFRDEECDVKIQCVLTATEHGTTTSIQTVDAVFITSENIICPFRGATEDSWSDGNESELSNTRRRRDDVGNEASSSSSSTTTTTTTSSSTFVGGEKKYGVKLQEASGINFYNVDVRNDISSIDCGSKNTCFGCVTGLGDKTFKPEICRWNILSGVCTTADLQGKFFVGGNNTESKCPAITGFSPSEAEAGETVMMIGEGLVDSEDLALRIVDKATGEEVARIAHGNYTFHNATHISFEFPDLPPGDYGVSLVRGSGSDSFVVVENTVAKLVRPEENKNNTLLIVLCTVAGVIVVAIVVCVLVALVVRRTTAAGGLAGFDFDIKDEPDYAKFKFAASLSGGAKLDKATAALIPLLQNPAVACAVCDATQSTERDKVTNSLIYIQASGGCALPFITTLINEEVPRTPNEKQLFRGDGVLSKAFRAYSKIVGLRYLWLTLGRVLNEIDYLARMQDKTAEASRKRQHDSSSSSSSSSSSGDSEATAGGAASDLSDANAISILDTEVDPSKLAEGANLDAKVHLLYQRCSIVLDPILKSEANMPPVLRWILHNIYQKVGEVFPGSEHIGIAGTLFLRFICPAITIPQTYGLLREAPIESLQRQLTLIAKVLQNTANNCNFGKKEPFMVALNGFIGTNCIKVADFMEHVAVCSGAEEAQEEIPQDVINASARFMRGHIANNLTKIATALDKRGASQYYQELADAVSQ